MLTENDFSFPDPEYYDQQGLVAIGGDLSPSRLLEAYRSGIFPWYEPGQPVLWWSPDPRMLLLPGDFNVSRSLNQSLKRNLRYSIDTAFSEVIKACATSSGRENRTWITNEMIEAYINLHELAYAHSFEVWDGEELVGGLYGLSLGGAFFGESMFHRIRDGSKIAFYHLYQTLMIGQFDFIDCQLPTKHLASLGAKPVNRHEFLQRLQRTLQKPSILF